MESRLAVRNSEFGEAAMELESTKSHLRFVKHAASLMWKQVQSRRPQLFEVEAAVIAFEVAPAAVEFNVQSLTA